METLTIAFLLTVALTIIAFYTSRAVKEQRLKAEDTRVREEIAEAARQRCREEAQARHLKTIVQLTNRRVQ